jgi:predicted small lipoprotein YifL
MGSASVNFALTRVMALALALGLAGCGVKGPLEPPPDSGIEPNAREAHAATVPVVPGSVAVAPRTGPVIPGTVAGRRSPSQSPTVAAVAKGTTSSAVVNAPAAQRRSVLDWLID